jgi:hypothetical protein
MLPESIITRCLDSDRLAEAFIPRQLLVIVCPWTWNLSIPRRAARTLSEPVIRGLLLDSLQLLRRVVSGSGAILLLGGEASLSTDFWSRNRILHAVVIVLSRSRHDDSLALSQVILIGNLQVIDL